MPPGGLFKGRPGGRVTQLELALDYAPQRLRDHGLRDAHTFPLVSPDTGKVRVSYRQPAAVAWEFPRLEMRAGNTWPCITVDCDGSRSLGKLGEVVLDEDLPTPNVIVRRVASGNCHAHFMLATPVHRGLKPLQALGRAAEWLTAQLEGDRGYAGVLTLNPEWPGPEFATTYLRAWPYEMAELLEHVPCRWRVPVPPATGIGRNSTLFKWAVKEAHRPRSAEIIRFHGAPDSTVWEGIVAAKNAELFGVEDLPAVEVRSVARSAARYSLRQYDRERFRERQAKRGRASGKARRGDGSEVSREVSRPWEAMGVSRATWYRHRETEP